LRVFNLSKKIRDEVASELSSAYGWKPQKLKDLRAAESEAPDFKILFDPERKLYLVENELKSGRRYVPLLKDEQVLPLLPKVKVDSGAVKFVCNGADIMRPGITSLDHFAKSSLVVVSEERYGKAISVASAKAGSEEIKSMTKGPALENLHYVGDRYWEALKTIV
jgi:PUA domain protein